MEQAMETRPGVPQNGGNSFVFDRPRSKRDPVHREGSGVPQNRGNGLVLDLVRSKQGPVDLEGCGIPQNRRNGPVLERYGRNGGPIDREGCGVPQNGTPRDTVHLHRRPPPASTGYCSSTPPPSIIDPALHGVVLFIQPSMGRQQNASCSWGGNAMPCVHAEATKCVLFIGRQLTGSECVLFNGSQPAWV